MLHLLVIKTERRGGRKVRNTKNLADVVNLILTKLDILEYELEHTQEMIVGCSGVPKSVADKCRENLKNNFKKNRELFNSEIKKFNKE